MKQNKYLKLVISSVSAVFIGMMSSAVHSATLGFGCITDDWSGNACDVAEAQMSVDVNDIGGGQIEFVFNNNGSDLSAFIADIYFYDDMYIDGSSAAINNGTGVSFSTGAKPGHLPGFRKDDLAYTADSDPSVSKNGVQAGESLGVTFDLLDGVNFADALAGLTDFDAGTFVIGIHVQGLPYGQSRSLITNVVPVPAAVWLFGTGLLGLLTVARKHKTA